MLQRVRWIVCDLDIGMLPLVLAINNIGWGAILLLPSTRFNAVQHGMRSLAPELVWGIVTVALGLLHLGAAVHGVNTVLYRATSLALAALWVYVTVTILVASGGTALGPPAYAVFAVGHAAIFLRLLRQPLGSGVL